MKIIDYIKGKKNNIKELFLKKNSNESEENKPDTFRFMLCKVRDIAPDTIKWFNSYGTGVLTFYTPRYKIPDFLSVKDVRKVLSYMTDKYCYEEIVKYEGEPFIVGCYAADLPHYGFELVDKNSDKWMEDCILHKDDGTPLFDIKIGVDEIENNIDFITLTNDCKDEFKGCMENRYFEWYIPRVKYSDLVKMYENSGFQLPPDDYLESGVFDHIE